MLKKLALVKGPAGYYDGKMGMIVAVRDEQRTSRQERTCLYKLLVDGQISSWLPGECVEIVEPIFSQDEAI